MKFICPDCGGEFDKDEERSDFNCFVAEADFDYDSLPYEMCCECGRRYYNSTFPPIEDEDDNDYEEYYNN